jgi:hypothetical protein
LVKTTIIQIILGERTSTIQGVCDEKIYIRDLLLENFQKGDRREKLTSQKAVIALTNF